MGIIVRTLLVGAMAVLVLGCTLGVFPNPEVGSATAMKPGPATAAPPSGTAAPGATGVSLPGSGLGSSEGMVIAMDLQDLSVAADTIVVAQVSAAQGSWNSEHTAITTRVQLVVEQVVAGDASVGNMTLTLPGGKVGETLQTVTDTPEFAAGERVLLFLQHMPDGSLAVVGGPQGKMAIVNGVVDVPNASLDTVIGQIRGFRAAK